VGGATRPVIPEPRAQSAGIAAVVTIGVR